MSQAPKGVTVEGVTVTQPDTHKVAASNNKIKAFLNTDLPPVKIQA